MLLTRYRMSERYHPDPDQLAFASSVSKSLASMLPFARLHQAQEESIADWRALAELGVFGIALPAAHGGSDLGATEEALIVLELGRRAVAPAVLATLGAAHLRQQDGQPVLASVPRVAAGYRRNERVVFISESSAEYLLVRSEAHASLHEYPKSARVIDGALWSSRLCETAELGASLAEATPVQCLRLRLIDAAALAGIARAALDMAVAYAGLREQFGRPIGTFQAIKHHCADMALAARCASDQLSFSAVALDEQRDDAQLQIENALYVAGAAALQNSGKNIQIHGGIGFSDEADPHRLLKRTRVLLELAGGLEAALTRIANYPVVAAPVRPTAATR
jgi:alkylation response protein AidB-like acyl-CoA dehydrogenase